MISLPCSTLKPTYNNRAARAKGKEEHAAPEWMRVSLGERSHDRSEDDERKNKPKKIPRPGRLGRRVLYVKGTTVIEADTMSILADILGVSPKAVSFAMRTGGTTKGGIVKPA